MKSSPTEIHLELRKQSHVAKLISLSGLSNFLCTWPARKQDENLESISVYVNSQTFWKIASYIFCLVSIGIS